MVSFALVLAAVMSVGELESDGCHSSGYLCCAITDSRRKDGPSQLGELTLIVLLGYLFGAMFGYSVGNLMAEDYGEGRLVLCNGQEAFVNDNLATRHTEGIDGIVLYEVEFPVEVLQFVGEAVFAEVSFDSCSKALADTLDEGCSVGIG